MKSPLTLALGIYLICFKPTLASSDLVTRQTCDEFYCTDWDYVLKVLGDAAGAASQWLDFSQPPSPETAPAPGSDPTDSRGSQLRPAPQTPSEQQAVPETPDTDPNELQDSQVLPAPKNPTEPRVNPESWIQAPPPELSGCQAAAPFSNSDTKDNPVSHSFTPLWINCLQVRSFLMAVRR